MKRIFRIADSRHPVWDGSGAAFVGGRWNSPGKPVIYGSLSYACAMLEILAHSATGTIPKTQVLVIADIPNNVSIEEWSESKLPPGWDDESCHISRQFGDTWLAEARSAVLLVPSVVARREQNAVVNPMHPDAGKLIVSPPESIIWDKRLFSRH